MKTNQNRIANLKNQIRNARTLQYNASQMRDASGGTNHKHRAVKITDRPFNGAVKFPENRAAHGNICRWEACSCGAVRATNINQNHVERSAWS